MQGSSPSDSDPHREPARIRLRDQNPRVIALILIAIVGGGAVWTWLALRDRAIPVSRSTAETGQTTTGNIMDDRSVPEVPVATQIKQAVATGDETHRERVEQELFPMLLENDRSAAAQVVAELPPGELREILLRRLARALAADDFGQAVDWIASLPDAGDRKAAFEDACFEVADSNPGEAIAAWESWGFSADEAVLTRLVQTWAVHDIGEALAWAVDQPGGEKRDQAVADIAYIGAQSQPEEAAAFVLHELAPGPIQTNAVLFVLNQWAQQDPAAATAWAAEIPPGPLADRVQDDLAVRAEYREELDAERSPPPSDAVP